MRSSISRSAAWVSILAVVTYQLVCVWRSWQSPMQARLRGKGASARYRGLRLVPTPIGLPRRRGEAPDWHLGLHPHFPATACVGFV
jgi:hypothetical protein